MYSSSVEIGRTTEDALRSMAQDFVYTIVCQMVNMGWLMKKKNIFNCVTVRYAKLI